MGIHFISEQVKKMRPSSFPDEERQRYKAKKMMLRQFMLMKQQDQVPDDLSVRNMKTWLLTGRSFWEEFQEIIEETGINHLSQAELAWTTARHFCVNQMEKELLEELDREKQLSLLFSREVTLEGLQMFVTVVHPGAEEDVQTFLPSLHSSLLRHFGGIQITSCQISAGEAKVAELLKLEQSAVGLVPVVVDAALKFLLHEPERENKSGAASAGIAKLLCNSAAPCLSQLRKVSKPLLLGVCTLVARKIVKAIYKRSDELSKSFHQMDYDDSFYSARDAVISAIQDMDLEVQTVTSSQADLQPSTSDRLEGRLLEERGASPGVSVDKEVTTMQNNVTEDTSLEASETQEVKVQDCDVEETKRVSGFFCGLWRMMTGCFYDSTEDEVTAVFL